MKGSGIINRQTSVTYSAEHTMSSYLHEAHQELKRVEHLLYVSLKYTRTVDVIKSVIDRMISCLDATIIGILEYAKEKKILDEIPSNVGLRSDLLRKKLPDPDIEEMINFFILLRKFSRAQYRKSSEFRRHVTMTVIFEEIVINIDIDKIKEYYDATVRFVEHAEKIVTESEE